MFFFRKKEPDWKIFLRRLALAIAVVMIWRGVWNLLDRYLLPEFPILSDSFSILIGLFILYMADHKIKHLID